MKPSSEIAQKASLSAWKHLIVAVAPNFEALSADNQFILNEFANIVLPIGDSSINGAICHLFIVFIEICLNFIVLAVSKVNELFFDVLNEILKSNDSFPSQSYELLAQFASNMILRSLQRPFWTTSSFAQGG